MIRKCEDAQQRKKTERSVVVVVVVGGGCVHASFQLKLFLPLPLNPVFLFAPFSPSISLSACISARARSKKYCHIFSLPLAHSMGTQI